MDLLLNVIVMKTILSIGFGIIVQVLPLLCSSLFGVYLHFLLVRESDATKVGWNNPRVMKGIRTWTDAHRYCLLLAYEFPKV